MTAHFNVIRRPDLDGTDRSKRFTLTLWAMRFQEPAKGAGCGWAGGEVTLTELRQIHAAMGKAIREAGKEKNS